MPYMRKAPMMKYNGVVIGGGPAGMLAAIVAADRGDTVLLIEKNARGLGRKLLITGKGRCNVTNYCTADEVMRNIPRNGRFLYSALDAFSPDAVMRFFEIVSGRMSVNQNTNERKVFYAKKRKQKGNQGSGS